MVLGEVADRDLVAPDDQPVVDVERLLDAPGALRISDFSRVVFPAPLRPISATFSPRETLAVKSSITVRSP